MATALGSEFVRGGEKLRKKLDALPSKLRRRAIGNAASKAAAVIVREAKKNAPVRTGAIKRNIIKQAWRSRIYAKVFAIGVDHGKVPEPVGEGLGTLTSSSGKITIKKLSRREKRGDDPFYFRWVELGWTHKKTGEEIQAVEYLQRAIKSTEREAEAVYAKVIAAQIEKLAAS